MAYFIFSKNLPDVTGTLYKIAKDTNDLDNLIPNKEIYNIIETNDENFNSVKFGSKNVVSYDVNNNILFNDVVGDCVFRSKIELDNYINNFKLLIKQFLDNNKNHVYYDRWNNYYNQLDDLDTTTLTYPFKITLEKYFDTLDKTSLSPLQIT
jgi:hypothetical protein